MEDVEASPDQGILNKLNNNPRIKLLLYLFIGIIILAYPVASWKIRNGNKESMKVIKSETSKEEDIKKEIKAVNNSASYLYLAIVIPILIIAIILSVLKIIKMVKGSDSSDESGDVTSKSLQIAMFVAFFLGCTGKAIEYLGFQGCFNDFFIDSPSSILLFDMFFTNTFAYFFDLVLAFIAAIALEDMQLKTSLINTNIKVGSKNIFRFVWYLVIIIAFWNLASLVRPKVQLLIEMFLGFDPISTKDIKNASVKNAFRSEDLEESSSKPDPNKDVLIFGISHKYSEDSLLVQFMNSSKGIITAGIVEAIIFLSVLFPLRHYYLYELGSKGKEGFKWWWEFGKFILAIFLLVSIFFLTRFLAFGTGDSIFEPQDKKEDETGEIDYNELAEKSITNKCGAKKYMFYALAGIIFLIALAVVCYPVIKSSGWKDGFKLTASLILYIVISFGSVILISYFLFPKEGDADDDDENSITNQWWFILNPGREDYNSFKNVLISFGIAAGVYLVMCILGTQTSLTKTCKYICDDTTVAVDTSVDTSVDVTPVDVTPVDTSLSDPTTATWGGGKSKRVKRKSTRRKR